MASCSPYTQEDAPVDTFSNLVTDKVGWLIIWPIGVHGNRGWRRPPLVKAHLTQEAQRLAQEATTLVPSHCVSRSETQKVADSGIVDCNHLFQHEIRRAHCQGHFHASIDQYDGPGKLLVAVRALQVEACRARKRSDQACNHAGQERQKLGIRPILAIFKCLPEGRLVREGCERVYICEEVIYQELQDAQRRNTLLCVHRDLSVRCAQGNERLGCIVKRRARIDWRIHLESSSLLCFSCSFGSSIGRTSAFLNAIVRARYVELTAGSTGRDAAFALRWRICEYGPRLRRRQQGGLGANHLNFSLAAEIASPGDPGVLLVGRRRARIRERGPRSA